MPVLAGRYQLLDLLGRGGMGTVWRALDLRERRYVAVKVLHQRDAGGLGRFVREQAVRIDHPHVAAPLAWIDDGHRAAFSLELVHGGSLHDLQRDLHRAGLPMPPAWGAELLAQLLDGVAAVHAAGLVHRDLKPANLLLEATGSSRPHLRIGDFGVAAEGVGARLFPWPGRVGTPGYAAPEQLGGAPADPTMDLHAVGVIGAGLLPHPGVLAPLLESLRSPDPRLRPASASAAGARLGLLRQPWTPSEEHTDGPVVPDRLGPAVVPGRRSAVASVVCLLASSACSVVAATITLSGIAPLPW